MPVTNDIAASYRRPGHVMRAHLERGTSESSALAFLMGGCLVLFVARWPGLARQAHLEQTDLNPLLGGTLMATVFILPLLLYALAAASQLVSWAARRPVRGRAARLALFWALLAASPLALLHGLIEGFIGPGLELQAVGLIWVGVFLWFWIAGLMTARATEVGA